MNLCYSHVCDSIGLVRIGTKFTSDEYSTKSDNGIDEFNKSFDGEVEVTEDPLSVWTRKVKQITQISAKKDISSVYSQLIAHIDKNHFKGKLMADSKLWLTETKQVHGKGNKILQVTKELVN